MEASRAADASKGFSRFGKDTKERDIESRRRISAYEVNAIAGTVTFREGNRPSKFLALKVLN